MTKDEADVLGDVIRDIERGKVYEGVRQLRTLISASGHRPPPMAKVVVGHPVAEKKQ